MGNCFRTTSTERRLKVPDPSANKGKEFQEQRAGMRGLSAVGGYPIRAQEGPWKEKCENSSERQVFQGRLDVKAF